MRGHSSLKDSFSRRQRTGATAGHGHLGRGNAGCCGRDDIDPFVEDILPDSRSTRWARRVWTRSQKLSLNANNQAHDIKELIRDDGAFMVSSACVNPSLTYMAVHSLAAFCCGTMKRGEL